jgi:hypothetical protein
MGGIITFGKRHNGKYLAKVVLDDPDWFFWAMDEDAFDRDPGLLAEAHDLAYKARNIKIPKPNPEEWCIRYTTLDGKFADFKIIEAATPCSHDSPTMFRADHLDLSVPRSLKQYDKLGCKLLLKQFKHYFLGSRDVRLTRRWCDQFFANPNNFVGRRGWQPISPAKLLTSSQNLFPMAESPPVIPIGQIGETQDEVSDEDWIAENEQTALSGKAEYRKRLEQEASYSWAAHERLRAEIEQENEQEERRKALAVCAEDERRREAIKAEAEESPLNWLFPQTDS